MTNATSLKLPVRLGTPPETTKPTRERRFPHSQISQNAPEALQEEIFNRAALLPGVVVDKSLVSVPGARAFHLDESSAGGPPEAFQVEREFAHIHPAKDGSLHLTLPPEVYDSVIEGGWGEPHPVSGTMMLYGPRNGDELEIAWSILLSSYHYARGDA